MPVCVSDAYQVRCSCLILPYSGDTALSSVGCALYFGKKLSTYQRHSQRSGFPACAQQVSPLEFISYPPTRAVELSYSRSQYSDDYTSSAARVVSYVSQGGRVQRLLCRVSALEEKH